MPAALILALEPQALAKLRAYGVVRLYSLPITCRLVNPATARVTGPAYQPIAALSLRGSMVMPWAWPWLNSRLALAAH